VEFVGRALPADLIRDMRVLEVGALDINGSARHVLAPKKPALYLGIDIRHGPGVDLICSLEEAPARLGSGTFDTVVCTEVLEHVRNWRMAVAALKELVRPGGWLILTTRSPGFPLHDFPGDFWRFSVSDMRAILGEMTDLAVESDPDSPGVFAAARMPARRVVPADLTHILPEAAPGRSPVREPAASRIHHVTPVLSDSDLRRSWAERALKVLTEVLGERGRRWSIDDIESAKGVIFGFDERLALPPAAGPISDLAYRYRRHRRDGWVAGRSAVIRPWFEPAAAIVGDPPRLSESVKEQAPTFVGIGASKSGTTWWYELLSSHPRYERRSAASHAKELLYFDQFLVNPFTTADADRYRAHFRRAQGSLLGEWTPVYIDQPWSAAQLAQAVPEARILVMVRDPVERALSDLRFQYPRYAHDFHTLDVLAAVERSRYMQQLGPWLHAFPIEQVHIIQYEAARIDPVGQLADTWRHLDVDDPCSPDPAVLSHEHVFNRGTIVVPATVRNRMHDMLSDDATLLAEAFPDRIDPGLWPTLRDAP
jgi:SAM-dependent methyltransferase